MHRALSTYLFRHQLLGARLLDEIVSAGFQQIEIYGDRGHFDYTNPSQLREIGQWTANSPGKLHSLHAPVSRDPRGASPHSMVSIAFLDRQRRQDSMDEIKRALETAELAPFRYLIVHLGVEGEEFDLRKFDAALTSLEHLCLFARQRGVEILLENITNEISTPRRLIQFFAHTHLRNMKVCLDTGHAHLDGGVTEAIEVLGGNIACAHLSDNNGMMDDHQFPPLGVISWNVVLRALAQAAPDAAWTIESRSVDSGVAPLDQARDACDQLQRIFEESRDESGQ